MLKHTKRRKIVFATVATAFAAALFGVQTPAANAHDQLLSSDPAHNSVVEQSPQQLTLTFSSQILDVDGASILELRDKADRVLIDSQPKVSNTELTQVISTPLEDGVYRVVWRVVSSDGHPIEGSFNFGVGQVQDSDLTALPQGRNLAGNAITLSGANDTDQAATATTESGDADSPAQPQDVYAANSGEDAEIGAAGVLWASVGVLALAAIITATVFWWLRQNRENDGKN